MLPTTREWVKKAEGDYDVVTVLLRSRKRSRYDPICFHAQQCVEKYLKARLTEAGIVFPKTHDLPVLLWLCATVQPLWAFELPRMNALTGWAILARYPGSSAVRSDAVDSCRRFREIAREGLGI
jgi:HEPN domain-containing protein